MSDNTEQSGGTRFNSGKPGMWWAIPMYGLRAVARVTMRGSEKYAPLDWACGQSYSTLIDSASRHWLEVLTSGPLARDEESGLLHLAHCAWNILCLLHFIEQGRDDLDDVSKWTGVTTAMKQDAEAHVAPERVAAKAKREGSMTKPAHPACSRGACSSPGAERARLHQESLKDRVRA